MMLTDSHCHLASHRFDADEIDALIGRARNANVTRIVTLATGLEDAPANLTLAARPGIYACLGIHPCDVHNAPDDAVKQIASLVGDSRVCAIGETGLDYYHPAPEGWDEASFRARQQSFLRQHFELAVRSGLNIVIHTRDRSGHASLDDALAIYREFHHEVRAVFHCFIGTFANARRVLDLGGIVSIGGVATFKSARDLHHTAKQLPARSFLLETDAPYLAPEPHRGKRNEPALLFHTAECIATLRGESINDLAADTSACADSFFRFRDK
ncbi:MAG: TatD family hydrolase [Verrucomicrobiota bacterium]